MRHTAIVAVALAISAAGCGGDETERAPRAGLEIVGVRYEPSARPRGADRAYPALVVETRTPEGQVVAITTAVDGRTSIADGVCGIATDTWTIPIRLPPGRHDVRVEVEASTCTRGAEVERAVEETTIEVPRR